MTDIHELVSINTGTASRTVSRAAFVLFTKNRGKDLAIEAARGKDDSATLTASRLLIALEFVRISASVERVPPWSTSNRPMGCRVCTFATHPCLENEIGIAFHFGWLKEVAMPPIALLPEGGRLVGARSVQEESLPW